MNEIKTITVNGETYGLQDSTARNMCKEIYHVAEDHNLLRFDQIEYTSRPSDLITTVDGRNIRFDYNENVDLVAWIPVTLEVGKSYTLRIDKVEGGVYGANYGNIRLYTGDKTGTLHHFTYVQTPLTEYEKTFTAACADCYLRLWYPWHGEFEPDYFVFENLRVIEEGKSDEVVAIVSGNLKDFMDGRYALKTPVDDIKSRFRYLVPTFYGNHASGLILLGSNDLRTFDLVAERGIYTALNEVYEGQQNTIRDPSIIRIGEYFYFVYTVIAFNTGADTIGFCRTKDFATFEELANLSVSNGTDSYDKIWAPSWFRDGENLYILSTAHVTDGTYTTVVCQYNADTHTLVTGHTITEVGAGIDYHMYHENGLYYIVGSGGKIYKSETIDGTYTLVSRQAGTDHEGDFCVKLDNGKWRVFMQQLSSNLGTAHMCYADIDSFEEAISDLKTVDYTASALEYIASINSDYPSSEYYHWTVYDFNNGNDNNNYFVT